jgi:anti-sigma factor RsiW
MNTEQRTRECPAEDALRRFVQGLISDEEAAPLEAHLEWCPRCLETLRALQGPDPLAAQLHGADVVAERLALDTNVQVLMGQLRRLRPGPAESAESAVPLTGPPDEGSGLALPGYERRSVRTTGNSLSMTPTETCACMHCPHAGKARSNRARPGSRG